MLRPGVTVAIPTLRHRWPMLQKALDSVKNQLVPAAGVSVAVDLEFEGADVTRTRAVAGVTTEWTALLDDDDFFFAHHLRELLAGAQESGADYVYSWPVVAGGTNPLPGEFEQWRPGLQTTTTVLVKTELAQSIPWQRPPEDLFVPGTRQHMGEDYVWTLACVEAGAKIHHVTGTRTWCWQHHEANTSGMPNRAKMLYG